MVIEWRELFTDQDAENNKNPTFRGALLHASGAEITFGKAPTLNYVCAESGLVRWYMSSLLGIVFSRSSAVVGESRARNHD